MNKFTTILALCCAFFFVTNTVQGQDYKRSIGLRFGVPLSASYKHFLNEKGAIEVTAGYRSWSGFASYLSLNGSYQHHAAINSVAGLKWYVGGGAGINIWSYDDVYKGLGVNTASTTFSVFGIIGLDYKFADYPINISADWAPTFFIGSGYFNGFGAGYGSLAARYTF